MLKNPDKFLLRTMIDSRIHRNNLISVFKYFDDVEDELQFKGVFLQEMVCRRNYYTHINLFFSDITKLTLPINY